MLSYKYFQGQGHQIFYIFLVENRKRLQYVLSNLFI